MKYLRTALVMFAIIGSLAANASFAQDQQGQFGNFEAAGQLPGIGDKSIDKLAEGNTSLVRFIGGLAILITGGIVLIALIAIIIAGYIYMTAGGNADQVSKSKTIIVSALLGIVLALASVLILRTINPALIPTVNPF